MPQFSLKGIRCGKYVNTSGTITYTQHASMGEAITATLELNFAEGRLYAEGKLAEYLREALGGSISIGTKYIPTATQQILFGSATNSRSVTVGGTTKTLSSLKESAEDTPNYVGVVFYAPDMVDGVKKFTAVFIAKALFGAPSMSNRTKGGNSIEFVTPTTTGEFMPDDSSGQVIREVITCDSEAEAIAWCKACMGET